MGTHFHLRLYFSCSVDDSYEMIKSKIYFLEVLSSVVASHQTTSDKIKMICQTDDNRYLPIAK